jgi:hypothetical protein
MLSSVNGVAGSVVVAQVSPKEDPKSVKGKAVSKMKAAGITLYESDIASLTNAQAADANYVDTIIMLHKKGAFINGQMLTWFSRDDAANKQFVATLVKLQEGGIGVYWGTMYGFKNFDDSIKEYSAEYVDSLIRMSKAGIEIDGEFIHGFESRWDDKQLKNLTDAIIKLHQAGIDVCMRNTRYISTSISTSPGKASPNYINALIKLHNGGVNFDGRFIGSFSLKQAEDPAFVEALIRMSEAGIVINFDAINGLSSEKVRDPEYMSALIKILRSDDGGPSFCPWDLIANLTLAKGKDPQYIASLIKLKNANIVLTGGLVLALTLEKGGSARYVDGLIRMNKAGIKIEENNYEAIEMLSLEEGSDPAGVDYAIKQAKRRANDR